jgi:hypothetical protein
MDLVVCLEVKFDIIRGLFIWVVVLCHCVISAWCFETSRLLQNVGHQVPWDTATVQKSTGWLHCCESIKTQYNIFVWPVQDFHDIKFILPCTYSKISIILLLIIQEFWLFGTWENLSQDWVWVIYDQKFHCQWLNLWIYLALSELYWAQ